MPPPLPAALFALYAYDADLNDFDFNNCLFDSNTAGDNGGAAYIQTDVRGIIASKFDNCFSIIIRGQEVVVYI